MFKNQGLDIKKKYKHSPSSKEEELYILSYMDTLTNI